MLNSHKSRVNIESTQTAVRWWIGDSIEEYKLPLQLELRVGFRRPTCGECVDHGVWRHASSAG